MLWKKSKIGDTAIISCKATLSKGSPSYVWSNLEHVFFKLTLDKVGDLWDKILSEKYFREYNSSMTELETFDFLRSEVENLLSDYLLEYINKNNIVLTKENFDCFIKIEILDRAVIDSLVLLIMGKEETTLLWEEK